MLALAELVMEGVQSMKHLPSLILPDLHTQGYLVQSRSGRVGKVLVDVHERLLEDALAKDPVEIIEIDLVQADIRAKLALNDLHCLLPI